MKATIALPLLAGLASSTPLELQERQSCPSVYVFGARETTVGPGYGTSQGLVNMVMQAYPGAQSAPISYPACGGQSSCGGISYDQSATQGTAAVVTAVTDLNSRCPDTKIVLIGYSQVCLFIILSPLVRGANLLTLLFRVAKSWTTPFAAALVLP